MQLTDIPAKFNIPWASSAVAPYISTVPQAPSGVPGRASLQQGFPSENFSPVAAGGVPPFGADFNGILNQITDWNQWQATGVAFPPYDATFQTAIAGYPKYAIVSSLVAFPLIYMSIVDNNLTNPDTGGAGWIVFWRQLTSNADLYVNTSTGNDSNNGLTLATPKKTIGAAVLAAWSFTPSSTFGVTIHVAAGTYTESVVTPVFAGPNLTIDGGVTATTLVSTSSQACFLVQGPNTLTVKNLTVQSGGSNVGGFSATGGATLITTATASNAITGNVFAANSGANVSPGVHTFNGNFGSAFFAQSGGTINAPTVNYTIGAAITAATAFAWSFLTGVINMPISAPATFTTPGNLTGKKFQADANGVIYQSGLGVNYFPGTVAGTTSTGGQCLT